MLCALYRRRHPRLKHQRASQHIVASYGASMSAGRQPPYLPVKNRHRRPWGQPSKVSSPHLDFTDVPIEGVFTAP